MTFKAKSFKLGNSRAVYIPKEVYTLLEDSKVYTFIIKNKMYLIITKKLQRYAKSRKSKTL